MFSKLSYKALIIALVCLTATWLKAIAKESKEAKPLTEACLYCLCEAQSGCNDTAVCVNGACGIFRITWGFWLESGQLTLNNESAVSDDAFTNCVNDPFCAADTVQSYMSKYGQDCNNDGKIDCYDYGALHKMGNLNCGGELPYNYASVFHKCLKRYKKQARKQTKAEKLH